MTVGGGRGVLYFADGDYPVAALRDTKTQQKDSSQSGEATRETPSNKDDGGVLRAYAKNVHSLQTELWEEILLLEVRSMKWDILLLGETCREKHRER